MHVVTCLHNKDVTKISMTIQDFDSTIERVMCLAERPLNEIYVEIRYLKYGGAFSSKYRNVIQCFSMFKECIE